jgi:Polyketide synthase dehydratase
VEFGPTLRTLCEFHYGEGEALAKIVVGEESRGDDFVLHPLIIDGVFQAGAVAYYYRRQGFQPSVLFSIDRLEIFAPTGDTCYAHLNLLDSGHGNTMAFDATVCNEAGRIVAHLTRVTIKIVTQPGPAAQKEARAGEGHVAHTDLFQKTVTYLKEAIAKVVKIPAERIDIYEHRFPHHHESQRPSGQGFPRLAAHPVF